MESFDFIEQGLIIRNVSQDVQDPEFKSGLTRGWYQTKLRDCLDELSIKLQFDTKYEDYDIKTGGNIDPLVLQMDMPKWLYNMKEIYVWNGDCCSPQSSRPVYWKRQYNNSPGGAGYTAGRTQNDSWDPFLREYGFIWNDITCLYWFNVQDGMLMLSQSCTGFDHLRIIGTSMFGAYSEIPCIPRYFKQVIEDWMKWKFFMWKAASDPRGGWASQAELHKNNLYDGRNGSWYNACDRVKSMTRKQSSDLNLYFRKGNW